MKEKLCKAGISTIFHLAATGAAWELTSALEKQISKIARIKAEEIVKKSTLRGLEREPMLIVIEVAKNNAFATLLKGLI